MTLKASTATGTVKAAARLSQLGFLVFMTHDGDRNNLRK